MTESKFRGLVPWGRTSKPPAGDKPPVSGLSLLLSGSGTPPAPALDRPIQNAPRRVPPTMTAQRALLVFAVDATASRAAAWEAAKQLTDRFFTAVPGELDVAFAAHGASRIQIFTPYLPEATALRKLAAGVRCRAGYTRLLPILQRATETGAAVVVYIGDVFEESEGKALRLAEMLKLRGTRVIILHDTCSRDRDDGEIFRAIAERTGGAVLPFSVDALERLGQMLEAVPVLAVGGEELVKKKQETMPGATLLLEHLGAARRLGKG